MRGKKLVGVLVCAMCARRAGKAG